MTDACRKPLQIIIVFATLFRGDDEDDVLLIQLIEFKLTKWNIYFLLEIIYSWTQKNLKTAEI